MAKNSWSFLSFAQSFGKPKLAELKNKETGTPFKGVAFCNENTGVNTVAYFSRNLGEMTAQEVAQNYKDLMVFECETSTGGTCYSIGRKGEMANEWETINIPLD